MKNFGYVLVLIILVFFESCNRSQSNVIIDEVYLEGGTTSIGDDIICGKYQSSINNLYVAKYEMTWNVFASAVNYGIHKKYLHIKNNKIYPLIGIFPEFSNLILDIAKNTENISNIDGKITVIESSENKPIVNIGWYGAALICNILSEMNNYSSCYDINSWNIIEHSKGYRMPTFEEWEYYAKGGNKSKNYIFAGSNTAYEVGWFSKNSSNRIHKVGELMANELGLFDVNGNVNEFCTETFKPIITSSKTIKSALVTSSRIWRGGSYCSVEVDTYYFRQNINNPDYYLPFFDVGLRTVRNK